MAANDLPAVRPGRADAIVFALLLALAAAAVLYAGLPAEEAFAPIGAAEHEAIAYIGESPRVNINLADESLLMELPGIGQVLASRIVEYRQANGPFESVEELTQVKGIGEGKLAAIRDKICAEP